MAAGRRLKVRAAERGSAEPSCRALGPGVPGGGVPLPEAEGMSSQYWSIALEVLLQPAPGAAPLATLAA